jgi:hypothetical protein
MSQETQSHSLVFPVMTAVSAGTVACIVAFVTRNFLFLFLTAGSVWVGFLFYLYSRWWPGIPFVRVEVKLYKGVALIVGLLMFAATWYVIIWLDPSLQRR